MKILIKLGGTLLDDMASRQAIAHQIAAVARGNEMVVVHGGGKQVTRYLEERGMESRFVNGLRVSDEAVMEAVTRVIAGSVNKQLVAAMIAAGVSAVGICGVDGTLTKADQLSPELGFVGRPQRTDPRLLKVMSEAGYVPVVACIAGDDQGRIYNVNADQMAVSCALGWGAEQLIFLTDVPGVKGADGTVIEELRSEQVSELVATRVAHGGMQAKLEAALAAVAGGVEQVVIAPGQESDICQQLIQGRQRGTRILPTSAPSQRRSA